MYVLSSSSLNSIELFASVLTTLSSFSAIKEGMVISFLPFLKPVITMTSSDSWYSKIFLDSNSTISKGTAI